MTVDYAEKTCLHGKCLNHSLSLKQVGDVYFEPMSVGFVDRFLSSPTLQHCGKKMILTNKMVKEKCSECGGESPKILGSDVLLCECCGHTFKDIDW